MTCQIKRKYFVGQGKVLVSVFWVNVHSEHIRESTITAFCEAMGLRAVRTAQFVQTETGTQDVGDDLRYKCVVAVCEQFSWGTVK